MFGAKAGANLMGLYSSPAHKYSAKVEGSDREKYSSLFEHY
jgi:hypothetical protein